MSETDLNPNVEETKKNLTGIAFAAAQVTAFALAVKKHNTIVLKPEPAWYETFKLQLQLAQREADVWMTRLSPQMFSKVPQSIIDYGNLFDAAMAEVGRILEHMGSRPTDDEKEALTQIFAAMLAELNSQKRTIGRVNGELKEFYGNVSGYRKAFDTARQAANKDRTASQNKRDSLTREIETLKAEVQAASTKTMVSGIALGVSLFVLVAAIAFTIATAGAAAPLIVGAVALVGAGLGVAGMVVFTKQQNDRLSDIAKKMAELDAEDALILALGQAASAIGSLVDAADEALKGLGTLLNAWATLETKLDSVIKDVGDADKAKLRAMISVYSNKAKRSWEDLSNYALILQRAGEGVKIVEQTELRQAA
ncbi:MAG: HBL/NHE enterotoxin family protein [Allosphingosinicella sp.]